MKLLTYQPLMVISLLFILSLSGLSGDVSASDIYTVTSNKVIVSLPDGELTEKTLRFTLKMDLHLNASEWHLPIGIDVFASENFRKGISPPLNLDEIYYESTIEIPKEYIESWSAMKEDTVNVWPDIIYAGSDGPKHTPITLVGASFVNSSPALPVSPSADEPIKREGDKLIAPLPDDELAGKSLLLTFRKTVQPISVHSIEIYVTGELVKTMGPYEEPYIGENYKTMAIPIPDELLESWSAMKLREVIVWPVFIYRVTNPGDIDPPLINVAIIDTSALDAATEEEREGGCR